MTKKLGATGKYPEGKMNEHDEGGLRMAVGIKDDNVIINFGKPVAWLGMPKEEALNMANIIIKNANKL